MFLEGGNESGGKWQPGRVEGMGLCYDLGHILEEGWEAGCGGEGSGRWVGSQQRVVVVAVVVAGVGIVES